MEFAPPYLLLLYNLEEADEAVLEKLPGSRLAAKALDKSLVEPPAAEILVDRGGGGGGGGPVDRLARRDRDGVREDASDRPDSDNLDLLAVKRHRSYRDTV